MCFFPLSKPILLKQSLNPLPSKQGALPSFHIRLTHDASIALRRPQAHRVCFSMLLPFFLPPLRLSPLTDFSSPRFERNRRGGTYDLISKVARNPASVRGGGAAASSLTEKDQCVVDDVSERRFHRALASTVSSVSWRQSCRDGFGGGRRTRGGGVTTARVWWRTIVDAILDHERHWLEFLDGESSCW